MDGAQFTANTPFSGGRRRKSRTESGSDVETESESVEFEPEGSGRSPLRAVVALVAVLAVGLAIRRFRSGGDVDVDEEVDRSAKRIGPL